MRGLKKEILAVVVLAPIVPLKCVHHYFIHQKGCTCLYLRIIKIQLIGMQQAAYNKSRLYLCGQLCHKFQYVHFLQFKNDNDKKNNDITRKLKGSKSWCLKVFWGMPG